MRPVRRTPFAIAAILAFAVPLVLPAQEAKAKRLASIVAVAVEEYSKGVDARGVLISKDEYAETTDFLKDAQQLAATLEGTYAASARATLDTLELAAEHKRPPAELNAIHARFVEALGTAGAMELPNAPLDVAQGRQIFSGSCASCHGAAGLGDGPSARALSTPPPAIGNTQQTSNLTPTLAYNVVSVGVRGTAMPAFATALTPQQRWNVVNYVYALRGERMALPGRLDTVSSDADRAAATTTILLDSALTFAQKGDVSAAGDRAFDAYLAFEPMESAARAKNPGLVASMERTFADFKVAVRRGDLNGAAAARESIVSRLPNVAALTRSEGESAMTAFWQSFLIILREGFEAILVIGAVVAFLIKTGHRGRLRSIWTGVGLALVASAVTAFLIRTLFAAIPASTEIIEAVSLLVAVVVLFSVSYWLISKVEAVKWQKFIRGKVTVALERGGGGALMLVAFLAVYREGAETALFYQALFNAGQGLAMPLTLGIIVGFAALVVIFVLFYRFGVKIPMRPFFMVTSLLLYYMAFVFAGRGIRELQEGNVLPMTFVPHVPHVDWLGLFPTTETLLAQGVLLALFVFALVKTFWHSPAHASSSPS